MQGRGCMQSLNSKTCKSAIEQPVKSLNCKKVAHQIGVKTVWHILHPFYSHQGLIFYRKAHCKHGHDTWMRKGAYPKTTLKHLRPCLNMLPLRFDKNWQFKAGSFCGLRDWCFVPVESGFREVASSFHEWVIQSQRLGKWFTKKWKLMSRGEGGGGSGKNTH